MEFCFTLHKGAFKEDLALLYGWFPLNIPTVRRNEVWVIISCWMSEVCKGVCIEPSLKLITGEEMVPQLSQRTVPDWTSGGAISIVLTLMQGFLITSLLNR